VNANLQQAIAASERIFEMLDTHTEVKERPGAAALEPFQDRVEFHEVGFGYDEEPGRILRGLSFTVHAGQMIAIVGRSGAGKTTLVNLLPRFYDVSSGAITIDGVDIRDVSLASLRARSASSRRTPSCSMTRLPPTSPMDRRTRRGSRSKRRRARERARIHFHARARLRHDDW
jgi:ABC-type multidrug transport system fused ATPase/permease subunit